MNNLLVCLPFYSGDVGLAKKNLEWMLSLDGKVPYECLLSCDTKTDSSEVLPLAQQYFSKVHQFRYDRLRETAWPYPQNNAFMHTAWHIKNTFYKQAFLWVETDSVPLFPNWIQTIEASHVASKKPFTGHWNYTTGVFNGVAVYPWAISRYAPKVMTASLVEGKQPPWDVYGSKEVRPHMNVANHLFQHIWHDNGTGQACTFPTRESVRDVVRPGVVLFHRCKDHSLVQWRDEIEAICQTPLVQPYQPDTDPTVCLLYIHPAGFDDKAKRFLDSYQKYPPEFPHSTIVIVNGGNVTANVKKLFEPLRPSFFLHDNSGWDIGAYLSVAPYVKSKAVLCLGAQTHFRRTGWLRRYVEVWQKLGPGMYGTMASNEIRPHLCTTGFMTTPQLLAAYPYKVTEKEDRYEFEWGKGAFWRRVAKAGLPVKMVTWDGIWGMNQLRVPPNIFRRGDQSNCLVYFSHSDLYEAADEKTKKYMSVLSDVPAKQLCPLAQRVDSLSHEKVPV